jgi:hypothetical protein
VSLQLHQSRLELVLIQFLNLPNQIRYQDQFHLLENRQRLQNLLKLDLIQGLSLLIQSQYQALSHWLETHLLHLS